MTRIDVVNVVKKSTENSVETFSICDIEQAKNVAANLWHYHNEEFYVVVQNEESFPRGRKSVKLDKKAKFYRDFIKLYHKNAITGKLECVTND